MSLGNRLYDLRKKKNISQEEAAEKLGVTRQTISKWETDQSLPDFDKILPICSLYEISTDQLLTGRKSTDEHIEEDTSVNSLEEVYKRKTAIVVASSVFLYFMAVIWIIVIEPLTFVSENVMMGVFLFICAIATVLLVFHFISHSKDTDKKEIEEEKKSYQKYDNIIALLFTIFYLFLSFYSSAWHITWILWIVYALVIEIVHLILEVRGNHHE